ncbi:Triacylglycerol lipase OBL1 [Euphorbia peplus]|nr:Triacylglycerol lipase OBL1 [Euphorbia peplus]
MGAATSGNETNAPAFLIVNPNKGRKRDIVKSLLANDVNSAMNFLDSSDEEIKGKAVVDGRWMLLLSIIIGRILKLIDKPMTYMNYTVEFLLNLLSQNGGPFGILKNLIHGSLKIPKRDTVDFKCITGHMDKRIELYKTTIVAEKVDNYIASNAANVKADHGNRYLMDICVVASKVAYENPKFIQNVVDNIWKARSRSMHHPLR